MLLEGFKMDINNFLKEIQENTIKQGEALKEIQENTKNRDTVKLTEFFN